MISGAGCLGRVGEIGELSVGSVGDVALVIMVIGAGVASPSLSALVANSADDDRRGEALGVQQSASALARVLGPPLAGLAFDHIGIGAPFSVGAAIYVIAIFVAFKKVK